MNVLSRTLIAAAATVAIGGPAFPSAGFAETTLRAVGGLPANIINMKNYALFRDKVNGAGKGLVQIKYLGGPEVTPGHKQAQALRRGFFDLVSGPPAYYKGMIPEIGALEASILTPEEFRRSGAYDVIDAVYRERLNAHVLAMPDAGIGFHIFLKDRPRLRADGLVDLSGEKIRSVATQRPLVTALGGSAISIPPAEVFNALERGVVTGVVWPGFDYNAVGWLKFARFRVDPQFLHAVNIMMVNLDKWKALPAKAREMLTALAIEHEKTSHEIMRKATLRETEQAKAGNGLEVLTLQAAARDKYLATASDALWEEVFKLAPQHGKTLSQKLKPAR